MIIVKKIKSDDRAVATYLISKLQKKFSSLKITTLFLDLSAHKCVQVEVIYSSP